MREQGLELLMNGAVSQPPAKASAMPVVGSNSLAIAAACHPAFNDSSLGGEQEIDSEQEEEDMALLPVQWGALPEPDSVDICSFTSKDVDFPEEGKQYQ